MPDAHEIGSKHGTRVIKAFVGCVASMSHQDHGHMDNLTTAVVPFLEFVLRPEFVNSVSFGAAITARK